MRYEIDDVRAAFKIFLRLIDQGHIPEQDREMILSYQRPQVKELIQEVIEREGQVKVFDITDGIYFALDTENSFLSWSNSELREKLKLKNNRELYLAYFVVLVLLAKFFNGEGSLSACRLFLTLRELEEATTEFLGQIRKKGVEELQQQEEQYQINFRLLAELWHELPSFDDQLVNLKLGRNNRVSFILRILLFLQEEGLVQVIEEREVRVLPKLEHLVVNYYFHSERKEMLLKLF